MKTLCASRSIVSLTSCRFISFGLRGCVAHSRTSNVSLHSLLSRRLAAGAVAVGPRVAVTEEEGTESVAEMTRVFIVEEEEEGGGGGGGGGGAALSVRLSLRKLMERCSDTEQFETLLSSQSNGDTL